MALRRIHRQLSPEGDESFAFTPDGSAVIYAAGNRVWRHPLRGGEREEIPIRLELQRPTPTPVLVRRVRVLDFAAGRFGPEISLFIEQGRIVWMGSERDHELPQETVVVDAAGRFAIPGLFDMHVHGIGRESTQDAYMGYGVTSVRRAGGPLPRSNALADRSEATNAAWPATSSPVRLVLCGFTTRITPEPMCAGGKSGAHISSRPTFHHGRCTGRWPRKR